MKYNVQLSCDMCSRIFRISSQCDIRQYWWFNLFGGTTIFFVDDQFAAKDRIMELEVLNDQLRKGQAEAEREAKSQQAASYSTSAELQKVSERLKAMPKRFTQSLAQLRDEVENLESEKLSLELAKQRRTLKVLPHTAYSLCDSVC